MYDMFKADKKTSIISIAYYKHMFHNTCLMDWFHKGYVTIYAQTCPTCRKQYNHKETIAEYNKLVQENQNRQLKSTELAKAI